MYFKKLEVFGFKSFADKTVLNFEPGITAIVGPNGCGKSNIFDAIRWVLGEQSVKELRGGAMEDIIFNGTDKKPPLGFAEVSLCFCNESKILPIDYNEVTVTRRLYRSGESEYLMNKTPVRLRDIQELFMGTGIGAEAYSLVQQGKVDLIVSARPEDRRIILDEASGITKYKSKKREALNKLADTENNLLRVNDIIVEVKRQIASIERQATKARRYKEEFEKLKHLEVLLARHELINSSEEKNKVREQLAHWQEVKAKYTSELEENNNLLENQIKSIQDMEQKINDIHAEEIKLENQIDIHNRQIGFNEERIQSMVVATQRVTEKKSQLIEKCRKDQERIEELKSTLVSLGEVLKNKTQLLSTKKESLNFITTDIAEAHKAIKQYEENALDITSRQVNVKNAVTEVMKEIQGCLARKRRLEIENSKVLSEKQEVDEHLNTVSQQIQVAVEKLEQLKQEQETNRRILKELDGELTVMDQTIEDLEHRKLFFISQKEFIEKLRVQYQDIPDPVVEGRLITDTPPLEHHTGIIGKVREVSEVTANHVFRFLGQKSAERLYEIRCEAKFIELDPQQLIVKIDEIGQSMELKKLQRKEIVAKMETQKSRIEEFMKAIHDQEKVLSILESQKKDIRDEVNKLVGELELVDSELKEARESITQLKKKEEELTFHLDTLNQDLEACQNNIQERQNFINVKRQEKEETTVLVAQLETEIEADRERQKTQMENLSLFEQTLDSELGEIKRLEDEQVEYVQKREEFQEEIDGLKKSIEAIKEQKLSLKAVLRECEKEKTELLQRLNGFRSQITTLEEQSKEIEQNIHAQELKDQEISFHERRIQDRLWQTYKINMEEAKVETMAPETQTETSAVSYAVGSQEFLDELERLKKRCESFGAVNLVAIEEFEELKQRFEFLTKQQSDLLEAKESLHQTINKINRQTRQMFMDTFTKVSEEFRIYFRMLFGGGEANLILLDPENVLESGIEIVARPPGKKLQNISLLSGGEKSLTAIALLFGVFKVRPSPFCVLDEIDAALDESNVGRFSYLLKDFSKMAQFIVITHNKRTIVSADVMYGITMQETGISKIVSVKFSDESEGTVDKEEAVVGV